MKLTVILRLYQCEVLGGMKIDHIGRSSQAPRVPKNVCCQYSMFNDILPIRDYLNNGHWLIWAQAWAISAVDWDGTFIQRRIGRYVRKNISIDKCWGFLHSRNASFDGSETVGRYNRIGPNATNRRFPGIKEYFGWYFNIVGENLIVHFPQKSIFYKKREENLMDIQYLIPGDDVLGPASSTSLPDSKALRSESDIFATSARGFWGV